MFALERLAITCFAIDLELVVLWLVEGGACFSMLVGCLINEFHYAVVFFLSHRKGFPNKSSVNCSL